MTGRFEIAALLAEKRTALEQARQLRQLGVFAIETSRDVIARAEAAGQGSLPELDYLRGVMAEQQPALDRWMRRSQHSRRRSSSSRQAPLIRSSTRT